LFSKISRAKRKPTLIEFLDDFVKALLAKIGDVEQVVVALHEKFTDSVDLCTLQAVAWALRKVKILDRKVEIRGGARSVGLFGKSETLRLIAEFGNEGNNGSEGFSC